MILALIIPKHLVTVALFGGFLFYTTCHSFSTNFCPIRIASQCVCRQSHSPTEFKSSKHNLFATRITSSWVFSNQGIQSSVHLQLQQRNNIDARRLRYYGTFAIPTSQARRVSTLSDFPRVSAASSSKEGEETYSVLLQNTENTVSNGHVVHFSNGQHHEILNGHHYNPMQNPKEDEKIRDEDNHKIPTENGGFFHTDESRAKISAANKGKTPWNKGRSHTEDLKRRISEGVRARNRQNLLAKVEAMGITIEQYEAQKGEEKRLKEADRRKRKTESGGYTLTEETRQKISQTLKEKWANGEIKKRDPSTYYRKDGVTGIRKGHSHSEATKQKIRLSLKNRWENDEDYRNSMKNKAKASASKEETRKRISQTLKNKWKDPEFRSHMMEKIKNRKSQVGTTADDEHRQKISEAMRKKWKDPKYRKAAITGMAKKRGMTLEEFEETKQKSSIKQKRGSLSPNTRRSSRPALIEAYSQQGRTLVRPVEPLKATPKKQNTLSTAKLDASASIPSTKGQKKTRTTSTAKVNKVKKKVVKRTVTEHKIPGHDELKSTTPIHIPKTALDVSNEEDRIALIRQSNPELYNLLYGDDDDLDEEDEKLPQTLAPAQTTNKFLSDEDEDDFDLDSFDPYGLDLLEKSRSYRR